jgi:hypothetical protein
MRKALRVLDLAPEPHETALHTDERRVSAMADVD